MRLITFRTARRSVAVAAAAAGLLALGATAAQADEGPGRVIEPPVSVDVPRVPTVPGVPAGIQGQQFFAASDGDRVIEPPVTPGDPGDWVPTEPGAGGVFG